MPGASLTGPIAVAGDITVDWLTWTQREASPGLTPEDDTANWKRHEITSRVARAGGAMLLARMLTHAAPDASVIAPFDDPKAWVPPDTGEYLESYVELTREETCKQPDKNTGKQPDKKTFERFGIARLRGFGRHAALNPAVSGMPDCRQKPSVLVLDDAGNGFRDPNLTPAGGTGWKQWIETWKPEWIVMKQSRPLGRAGDNGLWDRLRPRTPKKDAASPLIKPDRLIVVINADDLRQHGIKLTPRLSWERTVEDFVHHIGSNGKLATLTNCYHLLIRFGSEAVIHYRFDRRDASTLYYDPDRSEGDIVLGAGGQAMLGLTAAFTAAIAADIVRAGTFEPDQAIARAMRASAALARDGFRSQKQLPDKENTPPDYDLPAIFRPDRKDVAVYAVKIPIARISKRDGQSWRIPRDRGDVHELARHVALRGVEAALGAPVARYGKLVTADRREIEAIRAISNLLNEYIRTTTMRKPLSIAVFGPPGSGKSFTVKRIAEGLPNAKDRAVLEFNLSQFTGPAHLNGAFRLVQDRILKGDIPLVFFDEFDTTVGPEKLGWLKYFLAPMHDGEFRDGEATHYLGRAIFVFAGGTRTSLNQFRQPWEPIAPGMKQETYDAERKAFADAKAPDFLSRLRGHVDILGVSDNGGETDHSWPVRRAILFRSALKERAATLSSEKGELAIDDGVLRAFLTIPHFVHGSRSIEAILDMCALTHTQRFTPSCLPTRDQLALHVDADAFMDLVSLERLPEPLRGNLAFRIHVAYRARRVGLAGTDPDKLRELDEDASMAPWSALPLGLRESNYQQAGAIPDRLRRLRMYLAKYDPEKADQEVRALPFKKIDMLAELEHERYVEERLGAGWQSGPRDARSSRTPFLVPWCDLSEQYKDYDRHSIRIIPALLNAVGYRIYRMPDARRIDPPKDPPGSATTTKPA